MAVPADLEARIRNGQTRDLAPLTQAYYQTYGALRAAKDADPNVRNLIDTDDAMALGTLKAANSSDAAIGLVLQSGNHIEDKAGAAAPGSTPVLTTAGVAANIQSQAMIAIAACRDDSTGSCAGCAAKLWA